MNQQALLEAISAGFHKTTEDLILNISLILGLLLMMISLSVLYNRLSKNKMYALWQREYEGLIRKFDLTINEIDFIGELSLFLVDKRRSVLLLKNKNTFLGALELWKKKEGHISEYSERLLKKIYGVESQKTLMPGSSLYGKGRPARYVASDGRVFSGIIASRDKKHIQLEDVKSLGIIEKKGLNTLYIQDFRGIYSKTVTEARKTGPTTWTVLLSESTVKNKVSVSDIYMYIPGSEKPLKSRILRLKNGMAVIVNPGVKLKMSQAVKIAFRTDKDSLYRVNALVTGISLNKKVVRIKLGYIRN